MGSRVDFRWQTVESSQNVKIIWVPVVPGFVLEECDDLSQVHWQKVEHPVMINKDVSTVNLAATGKQKWFRLNRTTNVGLSVSISHDAVDVDRGRSGIQVRAGTTVHYSGTVSDSLGSPLTWQWFYTVDGGPWNKVQSGTGTVPTVDFTYGADSVGSTYVWTLKIIPGTRSARSHSTMTIE